jgi:apolipoprotein N-acyltransferase
LPVLLDRSDAARLQLSVASAGAPVLIGAQRVEGFAARNSLALVDGGGTLATVYDKHHLVPFGEYLPLRGVADSLGITALAAVLPGGYSAGEGPALLNLGPGLGHAFPMICYEAIFPGYIRRLDTRPDWMVHVTNDAWFGTFSGPWQHLALARLRAAEQGLPVLRAANTGVSAVIDGRGRVLDALPWGRRGISTRGFRLRRCRHGLCTGWRRTWSCCLRLCGSGPSRAGPPQKGSLNPPARQRKSSRPHNGFLAWGHTA